MNTESQFSENGQSSPWPTGAGAARRMARMLGRSLHVARPSSRRRPAPARRTRLLHLPLSRLHRAQRRAAAASPFLTECHRRRACSPLQKRIAQFINSFAVISSTSSTILPGRLGFGKGVIAISSTAAMAGPRRSWCSTRPTVTATFPSLLSLALATMNATEAHKVTH